MNYVNHDKVENSECKNFSINFLFSNKSFFFFFFTNYFIIFFHIYIKMSRDSSAEYYLDNKEKL